MSLYIAFQAENSPTDSTRESSIGTFCNFLADFGIDFSKSEIRVVQNKNLVGSDKGFLELSTSLNPEYSNLVQADNRSEHLYTELAEVRVKETVPSYHIPVTNVQCPDVKISEL